MFRAYGLCAAILTGAGALGCSDPPPPPPQAGLTLRIFPSGGDCNTSGTTELVGDPAPTDTQPGKRIVNGDSSVDSIACTVRKSGDGFAVSGQITKADALNQGTMSKEVVSFTMSGGTIGADGMGTANISLQTPQTYNLSSATGMPCTLDASSSELEIAAGRIWANFVCQSVVATPTTDCQAEGTIIFENCAD
jgi:hypothetical protein